MTSRTMLMAAGVLTIWCGALAGRAEAVACPAEPTDVSAPYGTQFACDIAPATDTDLYRFSGAAGDRILAEALFVSGGANFVPNIELIAPDGTALINTWSPARVDLVLPQSGTYTAVISARLVAAAGQYTFTVSCTSGSCLTPPPPPTPPVDNITCEAEPTDQFPQFGTRVTCETDPTTDTDLFRFVAGAGDRILAEALFLDGTANYVPNIELIAPDGTVLDNTWSPARVDMVLPQSGTYTAIISARLIAGTGHYAFTVSCIGGSCTPPPGRSPSLTLALTGCTSCRAGNLFTVQAHWKNPIAQTQTVELKIGLRLPDGTAANILGNKHIEFPVPASLDTTGNLFSFAWPAGLPQGTWTVEATMLGPDLGDTFSRSVKTFKVIP